MTSLPGAFQRPRSCHGRDRSTSTKGPIDCDVVGGRLAQPHRRSDLDGFVNSRHVVFALGDDTRSQIHRNVAVVKSNIWNLIRTWNTTSKKLLKFVRLFSFLQDKHELLDALAAVCSDIEALRLGWRFAKHFDLQYLQWLPWHKDCGTIRVNTSLS